MLKKLAVGVLACSLTILPGCAKSVIPDIKAEHYPQCVRPFQDLETAEKAAQKKAAAAGLVGLGVGFGAGLASGDWKTAIALGLTLATVSAIGTYSFASIDQKMEEEKRFATIRATADANLGSYNRFQMYCYESMLCYLREFDNLQNAYRAGTITKPEYTEKFKEIRDAMAVLGKSIGAVDKNLKKVDGEFVAMMNKSGVKPRKARVSHARRAPKTTRALVKRIESNNRSLQKEQKMLAGLASESASTDGAKLKKQSMTTINKQYDSRFVASGNQLDNLREANTQALDIMDQAALEAGIDMV